MTVTPKSAKNSRQLLAVETQRHLLPGSMLRKSLSMHPQRQLFSAKLDFVNLLKTVTLSKNKKKTLMN